MATNMLKVLVGGMLAVSASLAHAALDVDEATHPDASGDYNNLLSPPQPQAVVFELQDGVNTFRGSIGTPGDGGDTILLRIPDFGSLDALTVTFATNADDFNPVAINQNSRLVLDLTSSANATPLLSLPLTGTPFGPVQFSSGALSLGPELYNLTVLTEVLALNSSAPAGYRIDIQATVTPVPEPAPWLLFAAGAGLLGAISRRARRTG